MRARFPISAIVLALASAGVLSAPLPNRPQPQQPAAAQETSSDFLDQLNSCDSACAGQIARAVDAHAKAQQKQSPPDFVEKSKHDTPWQTLLVEAIAVQSQSCASGSEKAQGKSATKDEKEKARRLGDISARANAHIKAIADSYLAEFMRIQMNRVWNNPCPNYVAHIPSRRDPEDTEAQKDESATSDSPEDNR